MLSPPLQFPAFQDVLRCLLAFLISLCFVLYFVAVLRILPLFVHPVLLCSYVQEQNVCQKYFILHL